MRSPRALDRLPTSCRWDLQSPNEGVLGEIRGVPLAASAACAVSIDADEKMEKTGALALTASQNTQRL